jgi:hypothetical protein
MSKKASSTTPARSMAAGVAAASTVDVLFRRNHGVMVICEDVAAAFLAALVTRALLRSMPYAPPRHDAATGARWNPAGDAWLVE